MRLVQAVETLVLTTQDIAMALKAVRDFMKNEIMNGDHEYSREYADHLNQKPNLCEE